MEFGICHLSVIPVRTDPSDKSEMCTQILFGEIFIVFESFKNWRKVRLAYDNYEGWIDRKQYTDISEEEFKKINDSELYVSQDLVQLLIINQTEMQPILLGSSLPRLTGHSFFINETKYSYEGNLSDPYRKVSSNDIIENSYFYFNTPYLWGGRSPFGIDCSGFTQMVYKLSGIKLYRDANQQAEQGEVINLVNETEPGDLLFFDNEDKKIIHVGIKMIGDKIIHASGKVRIDRIDHQGIFNTEINSYTHQLRLIKRII